MNFRGGYSLAFFLFLFLFALEGCAGEPPESGASGNPQTGLETALISIASAQGPVSVEVEIARTETERSIGLMFRTELEDGKGMLFMFETDQILSFWMKNTLIPLSIAYISFDGTIVDIRNMHPKDLSPVHSSRSVRYALEVPQNWFSRAGVAEGDTVSL